MALVVVVALGRLFRYALRFDPLSGPQSVLGANLPDLEARSAVMVSRSLGKPVWRMRADRVQLAGAVGTDVDAYRRVRLSGISGGEFYRGGRREGTFGARSCEYDQSARSMDLGSLRMRSTKGDLLEAPHGRWVDQESYLSLDGGVRVRTADGSRLAAPEVLFSPGARVLQAPRTATAVVRGRTLTAGAIFWDLANGRLECAAGSAGEYGGVQFTAQGISIDLKSGELRANRAHIRLRIDDELAGRGE